MRKLAIHRDVIVRAYVVGTHFVRHCEKNGRPAEEEVRLPLDRDREHLVPVTVVKLLAISRPKRLGPTFGRDRLPPAHIRKGGYIDFVATGLVGYIRHPAVVGREHAAVLVESARQEHLRLGLFVDANHSNIPSFSGLSKHDHSSIGADGGRHSVSALRVL